MAWPRSKNPLPSDIRIWALSGVLSICIKMSWRYTNAWSGLPACSEINPNIIFSCLRSVSKCLVSGFGICFTFNSTAVTSFSSFAICSSRARVIFLSSANSFCIDSSKSCGGIDCSSSLLSRI